MVLITFSLAQEDSKKMQSIYTGMNTSIRSSFASLQQAGTKTSSSKEKEIPANSFPR
jgi:hypothetical protein